MTEDEMVSPTWWTWIWVNSRGWWWSGRPDVLWFMGSQCQTQLSDWTELNWRDVLVSLFYMSGFPTQHHLLKRLSFLPCSSCFLCHRLMACVCVYFWLKKLIKMVVEGTYLNIIKSFMTNSANIILSSEKLKALLLHSGTRQGCPLSPFLFNIVLES